MCVITLRGRAADCSLENEEISTMYSMLPYFLRKQCTEPTHRQQITQKRSRDDPSDDTRIIPKRRKIDESRSPRRMSPSPACTRRTGVLEARKDPMPLLGYHTNLVYRSDSNADHAGKMHHSGDEKLLLGIQRKPRLGVESHRSSENGYELTPQQHGEPATEFQANKDAAGSKETRKLYIEYHQRTYGESYKEEDRGPGNYWKWDRSKERWHHQNEETGSEAWF
ncbi:hypothetical protein F4777DRAFT_551381 [Nemania sp. FL0916]|nr:hypothetical protein F4777DRAFT_551381 [Nemania sp. FL0916]